MRGYRDLPVARHVARALTSPEVRDALANLIAREHDVVDLLKRWIEQDEGILAELNRPGDA